MATLVLRAVPWPAVGGITTVAVLVGAGGVGWPGGARILLPIAFALLAGAAAFVLDEPASAVVDVTPAGRGRRTAARALALLVPLGAGTALVLAGALRTGALPWPAVAIALAGSVLLGFAIACVVRRQLGEPGPQASSAAAFALIAPGFLPLVSGWVHVFPATGPHPGGLSSTAFWSIAGCGCLAAIAASVPERRRRSLPA